MLRKHEDVADTCVCTAIFDFRVHPKLFTFPTVYNSIETRRKCFPFLYARFDFETALPSQRRLVGPEKRHSRIYRVSPNSMLNCLSGVA